MFKKNFAVILAALILATGLTACSGNTADTDVPKDTAKAEITQPTPYDTSSEDTTPAQTEPAETEGAADDVEYASATPAEYTTAPTALSATKIGSINKAVNTVYKSGLLYIDGNKYAVSDHIGEDVVTTDYVSCESVGSLFEVIKEKDYTNPEDIGKINNTGLINNKGEIVLPFEYAETRYLGGRYYQVFKVTETTQNEEDYLIRLTSSFFSLSAKEGDILYNGYWNIFDSQTGNIIDGLSGTDYATISVNGDLISYRDDNGNTVKVDAQGKALPENAVILSNGTYHDPDTGKVYSGDHTELFTYDTEKYSLFEGTEKYFIFREYASSATIFAVTDLENNLLCSGFDSSVSIAGDLVQCGKKIYDLEKNLIYEGKDSYVSLYVDEVTGHYYVIKDGDDNIFVNSAGEILFTIAETDGISVNRNDFSAYKKTDSIYNYYNWADKDFTVNGSFVDTFLVVNKDTNSLVDIISGKPIIEGYKQYLAHFSNDGIYYVYAKTEAGTTDIYAVK